MDADAHRITGIVGTIRITSPPPAGRISHPGPDHVSHVAVAADPEAVAAEITPLAEAARAVVRAV
ncbi:hypothetical protein [Streptomyces sp. NPDC001880]